MKFIFTGLLICFISAYSHAVPSEILEATTNAVDIPASRSKIDSLNNRFGFGILILPIRIRAKTEYVFNGDSEFFSQMDSATAYGFEPQFTTMFDESFGVKGSLGIARAEIESVKARSYFFKTSGLYKMSGRYIFEAGLNLTKIVLNDGESSQSYNPGLGFQLGINYLVNLNTLFNFSYIQMSGNERSGWSELGFNIGGETKLDIRGIQFTATYLF